MNLELNNEDVSLLSMLLDKELGETRLEVRHAKNASYKEHLKDREKEIISLLEKVAPGKQEPASARV